MRKNLLFLFLLITISTYSQYGIVNSGAVINVGTGAVIYVDGAGSGDYTNKTVSTYHGRIEIDGKIIIEGDWTNSATSDSVFINTNTDGTVILKGSTNQSISGANPTKFESLEINNGNTTNLSCNTFVFGSLSLTNGKISTTSTDTLVILNSSPTAITSFSSDNYVDGNLRRRMSAGSFDFPLYSDGNYLPAIIDISDLGLMKYLSSSFTTNSPQTVPSGLEVNGTEISEFLDSGFWTFKPDDGTDVDYDITLTSNGHTNGGGEPEYHAIFKRDESGDWEDHGDHVNSTQSGSGAASILAKRTNLTGFSDFIIGRSEDVPLSISLISFEAQCYNDYILISWKTASEINNLEFVVEYSQNGTDYTSVEKIAGAGNSHIINSYQFIHEKLSGNYHYYRLKQVDYDGFESLSKVISCKCAIQKIRNIHLNYNNEGFVQLTFDSDFAEELQISLLTRLSKQIYCKQIDSFQGENVVDINIPYLASGIYFIRINTENSIITKKIYIQ